MTTLNGLPRSWDSFIQGICARKKLVKFSRLWEAWSQEEAWIATQEEKMGSEYQALMVHSKSTKRRSHHPRGKHYHKDNTRKYLSRVICYTCDEAGHYAKNCPKKQKLTKRSNKKETSCSCRRGWWTIQEKNQIWKWRFFKRGWICFDLCSHRKP